MAGRPLERLPSRLDPRADAEWVLQRALRLPQDDARRTLRLNNSFSGLPWGIFQTLTIAFASEVCPVPLRPFLTTYVVSWS
jgi:hypothetical protein